MDTPTVQSAREKNDATIRCEVKGDPEPDVSWYFNGQLIIREYDFFAHKYKTHKQVVLKIVPPHVI